MRDQGDFNGQLALDATTAVVQWNERANIWELAQ